VSKSPHLVRPFLVLWHRFVGNFVGRLVLRRFTPLNRRLSSNSMVSGLHLLIKYAVSFLSSWLYTRQLNLSPFGALFGDLRRLLP
jgi:hypothetical protein